MFFSGRAFSVTTFTRRYVFLVEYVLGSRLLPVDFFLILARHFRWTLLKVVFFFWSHIFGAGHSKSEGFVCGRAFSVATSAGLNVLLDASSFVANVSATCFVFMVGWFRSTLLKSGMFFLVAHFR